MAQITLNVTDTYTGDAIHAITPPTFCKRFGTFTDGKAWGNLTARRVK